MQSDYSDKELESYSSIINTYIELIKTRDFMNKIIDEVNLDTTPKALMNSLQFITKANTPIARDINETITELKIIIA